jgi:2-amino-4-hydroxy-6-hydroxymethyldihydropteridine diphosphokinase
VAVTNLAFIALGSNLGDSLSILQRAFAELEKLSAGPMLRSSIWRSTPVDCPPGSPSFLNAVAAILPLADETPETLLAKLQTFEREFGRTPKKVMNESRPIDLDLIAFPDEVRRRPTLILPHPRAHQRRFVLEPLAEIAPDLILPNQAKTVAELLRELQSDEKLERLSV